MKYIYNRQQLLKLPLEISMPCVIFLKGDLGAGKTTLSGGIIKSLLETQQEITSPTYVYYNKYDHIYHFDLYRIQNYDEFISIGGEEILDNNQGLVIVEWPEKLEKYYSPDIEIIINKTSDQDMREIEVKYKKKS